MKRIFSIALAVFAVIGAVTMALDPALAASLIPHDQFGLLPLGAALGSTVFTEGQHTGEFLLTEAKGWRSRDTGTVSSGQNLQAGTVLMASGNEWVQLTQGSEASAAAILYDNVDATDADVVATIITRDCEVITDALIWADGSPAVNQTSALAALKAKGIIAR